MGSVTVSDPVTVTHPTLYFLRQLQGRPKFVRSILHFLESQMAIPLYSGSMRTQRAAANIFAILGGFCGHRFGGFRRFVALWEPPSRFGGSHQ